MSDIEIVKNSYNTICDTYGCNNIGTHMIGKPGENLRFHRIMCDECLQNIINAAPSEMIMNRPELKLKEKFIPEDSIRGKIYNSELCSDGQCLDSTKESLENVGKALEGEENINPPEKFSYEDVKYQELKEIATKRGIKIPFGTSKDDLIEMIKASA